MAVRLAVPRLTDADFAELQRINDVLEQMSEGGDVGGFFETNAAFHGVFVAASGNGTLGEIYRQLLGQMGRYQMQSLSLRGNLQRSIVEHRAIVRAASERDAERASRASWPSTSRCRRCACSRSTRPSGTTRTIQRSRSRVDPSSARVRCVAAPANGSRPLVLLVPAPGTRSKRLSGILAQLPDDVSVASLDPATGEVLQLRGRTYVQESAAGHEYRVTGDGFWQIHRDAPETLVGAVTGFLHDGGYLAPGSVVADLYAGAGLFTAPLADAVGVTGSVLWGRGDPGNQPRCTQEPA